MALKKWVENIQIVSYNGAHRVGIMVKVKILKLFHIMIKNANLKISIIGSLIGILKKYPRNCIGIIHDFVYYLVHLVALLAWKK